MAKRMLIDASHREEIRVAVVSGTKVEEFDFESASRRPLKGNIYLAKVTRVEPSLQAAFVDYGGNRQGFLPFSEIHPDYFRIPVNDRRRLVTNESAVIGAATESSEAAMLEPGQRPQPPAPAQESSGSDAASAAEQETTSQSDADVAESNSDEATSAAESTDTSDSSAPPESDEFVIPSFGGEGESREPPAEQGTSSETRGTNEETSEQSRQGNGEQAAPASGNGAAAPVETVGGDMIEEVRRLRSRMMRGYKIQEVIKRRQVLLVQVTKEERGTKGAALTTYISLPGRYCVLMPNTSRGGGISRRITSVADRRRLKSIVEELQVPDGMAIIIRTAGSERSKTEVKRDCEYLLRLWDETRERTLKSMAPALIYEEGDIVKRTIRDMYSRDIEEVLVEGEDAYRLAKEFMRTLSPSHAKRVKLYREDTPLFQSSHVETQLEAMHHPMVQLKSGGYIVLNQTEALVAIDVNSGRATRERNIEETALRTNLEASDEIARQLRLRDLAGLIVIDYIDMEDSRNDHAVERRLKEALKQDRARIQLGRISHFGLLEMSRQRLRPSLAEGRFIRCETCLGTGHVRTIESSALQAIRTLSEEAIRHRGDRITIHLPTKVAFYLLNQKRDMIRSIEERYGVAIRVECDDSLIAPAARLEYLKGGGGPVTTLAAPAAQPQIEMQELASEAEPAEAEEQEEEAETIEAAEPQEGSREPREGQRGRHEGPREPHAGREQEEGRGRGRRRGRRGRGRGLPGQPAASQPHVADAAPSAMENGNGHPEAAAGPQEVASPGAPEHGHPSPSREEGAERAGGRRRRRGRRGSRRRRGGENGLPQEGMHGENGASASTSEPTTQAERYEPSHAAQSAPTPEYASAASQPNDYVSEPAYRSAPEPSLHPEPEQPYQPAAERSYQPEPVHRPAPYQPEPERSYQPEPVHRPAPEAAGEPAVIIVPSEPRARPEPESAPPVAAPVESTEPPRPPRRGWWQRVTS
jgi:ribonuclease E